MGKMADTVEILKAAGLEEYGAEFEDQGITPEILPELLKGDNLKELFPQLGNRLLVKTKLEKYFNDSSKQILTFEYPNEITYDVDLEEKSLVSATSENIVIFSQPNTTIPSPIASSPIDIQGSNLEILSEIQPETKKSRTWKWFLQNFNLKSFLDSSQVGKALLSWYSIKGGFDSTRQSYLVDLITSELLNYSAHVKNDEFDLIAEKIITLFPCETKEAYYLPPVRKRDSRDHKSGVARGKLVDKYRNKLTFLREAGILSSRSTEKNESQDTNTELDIHLVDTESKNSLVWLEHNRGPLEEVYKHWELTFGHRRQQILKNKNGENSETYTTLYPILKSPLSLTLIEKDFENIYPHVTDIYSSWEIVISKLITLRKRFILADSDKILIDLLESENVNKDYKHYVMLSLLASLLPCKSRHVYGSKQWKPKLSDCKEGIIVKVEVLGDIETEIQIKSNKFKSLGIPVQPFVIVETFGPVVKQTYVYIFGEIYPVATVLKGIDACFKAYHVFHFQYQYQSEHIWIFIQNAIYNLQTKWDIKIPNILDIVHKINQL